MSTSFLLRQLLPTHAPSEPDGSPMQQAFRQAIGAVEALRAQLHTLRAAQTATRQLYWRQVGPLAAAAIAARRALYFPLETALTGGYLSRAETQQVTALILHNAHSLATRFGEDESAVVARYAPPAVPPAPEAEPTLPPPGSAPHEQAAAAAQTRRRQQARRAREARTHAAATEAQGLAQHTKAAYRQLARLHHPDRAAQADAPTQQAQTALMQRITAAYAAGDLAALLALLAESPSGAAVTAETDALLQRYTQALAQQQALLSQQLAEARQPLADAPWSGTEKQQRTRLRQIKRELRAETDYLAQLERQLHEPASLRTLLRALAADGQGGF